MIFQSEDFIDSLTFTSLGAIMIHTGVNDIDDMDGKKVCIKLFTIINKIESKFPGIKVIVSEITPRMDNRDSEVKICNNMMNSFAKHRKNIFVAGHSNLRGTQFFVIQNT